MIPKLSSAALALALVTSHPAKTASSEPDLATVRAATARFQDVKQAIAEAMQVELKDFGIQVQTINPGPFFTGFNERAVEAALRWLDDDVNFTKRAAYKATTDAFLDKPEMRLDPNDMIAKMVELIPENTGPFRNIFPKDTAAWAASAGQEMWERTI